jgi:hypothetical protein
MRDAMALDNGLAALAVERKRHRQDGLERIALRAPCRRNISLARRNARGEIENVSYRLRCQAGTIVGYSNPILRNDDFDNGRNSSLLSGVEGIVDQLLQDNKRPIIDGMAGLIDKLFLRAKFRKPRCFEDAAAKRGRTHMRDSSTMPRGAVPVLWPRWKRLFPAIFCLETGPPLAWHRPHPTWRFLWRLVRQ